MSPSPIPRRLEPFAEFGIILLLFSIGLELSFNRLWAMRKLVFGLGAAELLSLGAADRRSPFYRLGQYWTGALGARPGAGAVLDRAGAAAGRHAERRSDASALAMLLFEDIALVPIIFMLGALAPYARQRRHGGPVPALGSARWWSSRMLVLGRFVLPRLFAQAARTKSPELFLAVSLLVVITREPGHLAVGLSPIVGALIAGLLIAETEYHSEVEGIIAPFNGLGARHLPDHRRHGHRPALRSWTTGRDHARGGRGAGRQGARHRPAAALVGPGAGSRPRPAS